MGSDGSIRGELVEAYAALVCLVQHVGIAGVRDAGHRALQVVGVRVAAARFGRFRQDTGRRGLDDHTCALRDDAILNLRQRQRCAAQRRLKGLCAAGHLGIRQVVVVCRPVLARRALVGRQRDGQDVAGIAAPISSGLIGSHFVTEHINLAAWLVDVKRIFTVGDQ